MVDTYMGLSKQESRLIAHSMTSLTFWLLISTLYPEVGMFTILANLYLGILWSRLYLTECLAKTTVGKILPGKYVPDINLRSGEWMRDVNYIINIKSVVQIMNANGIKSVSYTWALSASDVFISWLRLTCVKTKCNR